MTRRPGTKTARFAYDPAVMVDYIEFRTRLRPVRRYVDRKGQITPVKYMTRFVNGVRWNHPVSGRTLSRWAKGQVEISKRGAARFLGDYGLTTDMFERWARRRGRDPILRNVKKTTKEATDGQ